MCFTWYLSLPSIRLSGAQTCLWRSAATAGRHFSGRLGKFPCPLSSTVNSMSESVGGFWSAARIVFAAASAPQGKNCHRSHGPRKQLSPGDCEYGRWATGHDDQGSSQSFPCPPQHGQRQDSNARRGSPQRCVAGSALASCASTGQAEFARRPGFRWPCRSDMPSRRAQCDGQRPADEARHAGDENRSASGRKTPRLASSIPGRNTQSVADLRDFHTSA